MSRRGARVLALGWKDLGRITPQQVREITREKLESGLKFAGFVIISCPLKPDSKHVIQEIINASHLVRFCLIYFIFFTYQIIDNFIVLIFVVFKRNF